MKKLLTLMLFVLASHISFAQYQSFFGANSTSWNVLDTAPLWYRTDSLVITGDTIINSNSYKTLTRYELPNTQPQHPIYIREDTLTGKLFNLQHPDSTEILIVNLSLNIGEIFTVYGSIFPIDVVVDSVFYVNGAKQVRLNYNIVTGEKLIFKEGVGSNLGATFYNNVYSSYLLCQNKDGINTFVNTHVNLGGYCKYDLLNTAAYQLKSNFQLFPNPTQNNFTISYSNLQQPYDLTIIDNLGKQVFQEFGISVDRQNFDIKNLKSGLYFVQITTGSEMKTYKLVKQ